MIICFNFSFFTLICCLTLEQPVCFEMLWYDGTDLSMPLSMLMKVAFCDSLSVLLGRGMRGSLNESKKGGVKC